MKPLAIWGASGQAKGLREFLGRCGYEVAVLFDNDANVASPFAGVPIFHGRDGFSAWREASPGLPDFLVAIGGDRGQARMEIHDFLVAQGLNPATVVHPTAFVAADARLRGGCQIMAQAAVCVEAELGSSCIVNTGASVDHESILGDGVHVAPGAVIAGCVRIGSRSMIGCGAVVLPRISIGSDTVIGAGAVVTESIPDRVIAYGVPARIIRRND